MSERKADGPQQPNDAPSSGEVVRDGFIVKQFDVATKIFWLGKKVPTDDDWRAYLTLIRSGTARYRAHRVAHGPAAPPYGALVLTDGGAPSAAQRQSAAEATALESLSARFAVVGISRTIVVVMNAMRLLGGGYKDSRSFLPEEIAAAARFLGLEAERHAAMVKAVAWLAQQAPAAGSECVARVQRALERAA